MKSVIYNIFHEQRDENTRNDFVKFSKGIFDNRYIIEGKKQKNRWAIKTSAEFTNFFVRKCLNKVQDNVKVKGIIVCTFKEILNDIKFEMEKVKKYQGINQIVIDTETSVESILDVINKYPRAFYALSFSGNNFELKIKAKTQKNGKPGSKEKGPKANFCSLKTADKEIIEDLFFDYPVFQEIKIKHKIEVRNIKLPDGIDDPKEIRDKSVRKGVLKRFVEVDGRKEEKEKEFEV